MRTVFAGMLALAIIGCDQSEIQETADTLDALVPKLIPDEFPEIVNGTSHEQVAVTVSAVFVPGAWAENENAPDQGVEWSRFPEMADGWPGREYTPVSACEAAGGEYPATAQRCSATIFADRSGTYYLRWRYAPAPPSDDPGFAEPAELAAIAVSLPPPPTPVEPQDAAFVSLNVAPDPICRDGSGTFAEVTYAFDFNDEEVTGANAYCVTLEAGGNVIDGMNETCFKSDDDEPEAGAKLVDLNSHFGSATSIPSEVKFEAFLHQKLQPHRTSAKDKIAVARSVELCGG